MSRITCCLLVIFLYFFVASAAHAQFHDNGMTSNPIVKTEYVNSQTGTASVPLTLGTCLWGGCITERTVYPQSNYWRQNWPCNFDSCTNPAIPYDLYWSLLLNNEPRNDTHNSGPPDASLPRSWPGSGLMGFSTLYGNDNFPGDTRWRAHLVTNFINFQNPVNGGIPFLGFGEFSNRGNGNRTLAYLRPSTTTRASILKFGERLWGVTLPTQIPGSGQPPTLASYLWVLANWGTKPKAIFVTLYHYNIPNSTPPGPPATNHFNWRLSQSALYPGAEIVYIDAEDMSFYCPGISTPSLITGQDVNYRIDLTALFSCVSNRGLFTEAMPTTSNIPVTQVLWANETTGLNGSLWVDVHDQKTVSSTAAADFEPEIDLATADSEQSAFGWETSHIANELHAQCQLVPGCLERSAIAAAGRQSTLELPIEQQLSRPELLRATQVMAGLDLSDSE
jgi:hypothetical protein